MNAVHTRGRERVSVSARFSEGMCYVPFSPVQSPPPPRIPFVFISSEPVVICCDKAASTGGARVSRVEGHTASVRRLLRGLVGLEERAEELWYICNHVTRYVPFRYNCSPVTNCLRTFFFTLWPRARTYNTSRRRTEWESCLEFLRVPVYLRVRKVGLFVNVKICTRNRLGIVRIIILLGTIRDVLIVIPANSFYLK